MELKVKVEKVTGSKLASRETEFVTFILVPKPFKKGKVKVNCSIQYHVNMGSNELGDNLNFPLLLP